MSSSSAKFLLDENVRVELSRWLTASGVDVIRSPKRTANGALARRSLTERRVLVTNDEDFTEYAVGTIFGVVWLRIPQDDPDGLIRSFARLLKWPPSKFQDKLVMLSRKRIEVFSLWEERRWGKLRVRIRSS